MMEEAKRLASEGKSVAIIVGSDVSKTQMESDLSGTGVRVVLHRDPNIDWERLAIKGWNSTNAITLIDHYAIEQKYSRLLEMLHRYDQPIPPQ